MKKLYVSCVFCAATLLVLSSASAQPALERLEQDVRRQLDQRGKAAGPAAIVQPSAGGQAVLAAEKPATPAPAPDRGYLGALLDDSQDRGRGVRIMRVNPGSPAEKAGLQKGDLITALSGIRVRQLSEVADILEHFPPDTEVTFFVRRGGAEQLISVTLGRQPAGAATGAGGKTDLKSVPRGGRPAGVAGGDGPVPPLASPVPKPPTAPSPDVNPPAQGDTLLQRIEALERDVRALKEQNKRLEERIDALQRAASPKAATP